MRQPAFFAGRAVRTHARARSRAGQCPPGKRPTSKASHTITPARAARKTPVTEGSRGTLISLTTVKSAGSGSRSVRGSRRRSCAPASRAHLRCAQRGRRPPRAGRPASPPASAPPARCRRPWPCGRRAPGRPRRVCGWPGKAPAPWPACPPRQRRAPESRTARSAPTASARRSVSCAEGTPMLSAVISPPSRSFRRTASSSA